MSVPTLQFVTFPCRRPLFDMEGMEEANFLAVIEGQDYKAALKKIVSIFFHIFTLLTPLEAQYHIQMRIILRPVCPRIRMLQNAFSNTLSFQGFSTYHFTPLEVLVVIKGCQRRTGQTFTSEEIENDILKEHLVAEDFDLARVVSTYFIAS